MNKASYQQYLRSSAWCVTRQRRLAVSGNRCEFRPDEGWDRKVGTLYGERCGAIDGLDVHHLHYRTLGVEQDADLEVLCRFHHLVRHVTSVECSYCGETVQTDGDVAVEMVEEAIASAGGDIRNVDLENILFDDVCDHCDHILNSD